MAFVVVFFCTSHPANRTYRASSPQSRPGSTPICTPVGLNLRRLWQERWEDKISAILIGLVHKSFSDRIGLERGESFGRRYQRNGFRRRE